MSVGATRTRENHWNENVVLALRRLSWAVAAHHVTAAKSLHLCLQTIKFCKYWSENNVEPWNGQNEGKSRTFPVKSPFVEARSGRQLKKSCRVLYAHRHTEKRFHFILFSWRVCVSTSIKVCGLFVEPFREYCMNIWRRSLSFSVFTSDFHARLGSGLSPAAPLGVFSARLPHRTDVWEKENLLPMSQFRSIWWSKVLHIRDDKHETKNLKVVEVFDEMKSWC